MPMNIAQTDKGQIHELDLEFKDDCFVVVFSFV